VEEWETRAPQKGVAERPCGFESHRGYGDTARLGVGRMGPPELGSGEGESRLARAPRTRCRARPRDLVTVGERPGRAATTTSRDTVKVRERLVSVQERLRRTRASLRVLEEQVAYLGEIADDAETRKIVAQTPLADREWRDARTDHERHVRLRDEARGELEELAQERDRLLDRLLEMDGGR
jgi:chromosome segregation ATPase